jgi:hypothetical protein
MSLKFLRLIAHDSHKGKENLREGLTFPGLLTSIGLHENQFS